MHIRSISVKCRGALNPDIINNSTLECAFDKILYLKS